jgi:hypothetical protein
MFSFKGTVIKMNEHFKAMFVYSFMNICSFMGLNKEETLNVLKAYLFHIPNKSVKLDETYFFEEKTDSK